MEKLLEAVKEASISVTHLQDQITIIKKYLDPFTVEELDTIKEDKNNEPK